MCAEFSEANGRNANKVVLYEDASKKQLQQFISTLRGCEIMANACFSLGMTLDNTDSKLLHDLLTPGMTGLNLCKDVLFVGTWYHAS